MATVGTGNGVFGDTETTGRGAGVYGLASATTGDANGVYGETNSNSGVGVYGRATGSTADYAGYFFGNVHATGTIGKSAGFSQIDNPLDPANQYLYLSSVESPDMKTVYDGVVVLDAQGEAWVEMPEWFEAVNQDYRYQLTCIGGYAPVYIAQEIQGNRFQIAGGMPNLKVSWQVTGIRHDPYAEQYRIPVVEDKPANERGTYLHPELYGQPAELGRDYRAQ